MLVLSQLDMPCYVDSHGGPAPFNGGDTDGGSLGGEWREWENRWEGKLWFVWKINEKN